jgi:hypothetical protein
MSDTVIFIVGSIIFAITVYGSVMGGGIALGRLADSDDHETPEPSGTTPVVAAPPSRPPAGSEPSNPT